MKILADKCWAVVLNGQIRHATLSEFNECSKRLFFEREISDPDTTPLKWPKEVLDAQWRSFVAKRKSVFNSQNEPYVTRVIILEDRS